MFIKNRIILQIFLGMVLFNPVNGGQKVLISNKINNIYSSSVNDLWIGTSDGISRIKDGKYNDLINFKKGEEIKGITEDTAKNIYFGAGKKIIFFNAEKENEEKIIEPSGMGRQDSYIQCLAVDKDNNIWIGRYNDMLSMYNGKNFTNYPVWDVSSIDCLSSGDVWIGTKTGLYCVKNGILEEFNTDNSDLPDNEINNILVDDYDNLWLATNYGLVKYNHYIWIVYNMGNSPLKNDQVTSVYADENGFLIVGTRSGDLQIIKNNKWQELDLGLKGQVINSVFKDSKDVILI